MVLQDSREKKIFSQWILWHCFMKFFKVTEIIYNHICSKQRTLNLFLKLLGEPHCVRSGMCPLILPLSSWRKPESKYSSGGSPSGLRKIQAATFFPPIAICKQQENLSDALFMEMWLMTEKVWQSHVQLSAFPFPPYVYDVKYINHCYLSNFPMTCIFKFQNFHTAPF